MKKVFVFVFSLMIVLSSLILVACNKSKYTVSKEEWEYFMNVDNFTINYEHDNERSIVKYTNDAIDFDGSIYIYLDGVQYSLVENEGAFVAYEFDILPEWGVCLLADMYYDDFTFDNDKKAYILEEEDRIVEVFFENAVLFKLNIIEIEEGLNPEEYISAEWLIYDINNTVIDIPEYTIYESPEYRTSITLEEWNTNANLTNYKLYCFFDSEEAFEIVMIETNNGTYRINDVYYVEKDGIVYRLEEKDNGYVAVVEENFFGISGSLLFGLSFEDLTYDEEEGAYISNNTNEDGFKYGFYFKDGYIIRISIFNTNDVSFEYMVLDYNLVNFELPEYSFE